VSKFRISKIMEGNKDDAMEVMKKHS